MKYLRLFEDFDSYDPYELMMIPPNKKAEMIMKEIKKLKPNLNLVQDLIVLGANVNWQDEYGQTLMYMSVYQGYVKITRMLVDAGADVNVQDKNRNGETPLHRATYLENVETVRMLIDAGADVNIQDDWGETPLHKAAEIYNMEIVQTLLDAGADETILNFDGLRWDEIEPYDK